ncbi:aryl hydrocarbon receptor-like isoform X2 [Hypomesus transpacificus]|uniref:aryl hydrocarbon receptor-like isoform X2 n=1 Tax=Hypomesus transpacificus TaxID=137520 RepID=UPI001F082E04|nr:aryl hydrocarbon receptor-like isoform X2 [Hypomesus transpacificus]
MLGDDRAVYAAKKRKKPAQKMVKPSVVESPAKTNPSKRHRDRLNGELERLTSLLPFSQEVKGRLDKLSILRLSVGYLKVKRYFNATLQKSAWTAPSLSSIDGVSFSESDLLLQALNGFVLVVTTDGGIFYTSSTIQDYLGFHQSDVAHQSVYDLIHVDDRDMFRCQLHFFFNPNQAFPAGAGRPDASGSFLPRHIPPENSSFLERTFCCRFRCLHDNSSGFLPLNFEGRLKYVDVGGQMRDGGTASQPQLALFAIATPLLPPSVMEIRTKTIVFQTKHKMDFAPTSIDTRGRVVLGYSEVELVTRGSGYEFIHAADMMYCADIHLKMIKTGESGLTVFRLLSKPGVWIWVQAHARVVFKDGKPDFIVVREKVLTNEEGEEHLRRRRLQQPFNFATGEALLYESCSSLETPSLPAPSGSSPPAPTQAPGETSHDPGSLLGSLLKQDRSVYTQSQESRPSDPDPAWDPHLSLERAFTDSYALLSVPGELQDPQRARPGGLAALAMLDSLGEILGEMGDGGRLEGLDVQETELRDWESALLRIKVEKEEFSRERSDMLANDVFSYVEEALRKENNNRGPVID